jgi:hypothetical protein
MARGVARKSNNFHPKRTEVIWHTRRADVMVEIGKILDVEKVTMETPGWFSARTRAIKHIVEKMNTEELRTLNAEVEAIRKKGYDEKQQQR